MLQSNVGECASRRVERALRSPECGWALRLTGDAERDECRVREDAECRGVHGCSLFGFGVG